MKNLFNKILPLLLFAVIYVLFNYDGKLIDNDTIEYIKFAQDLENGVFPTSGFYQPGVGFLVFIVSKLIFCDLLTAFSVVNFLAGLGLVWVLSEIWSMEYGRKGLKWLIAALPVILYLSSLLYADIVFDFFAFFALFNLLKFAQSNASKHLIIASVLTAISIFMKYNGIALMLVGTLFIAWLHIKSRKLLFFWKPALLYISFPSLYLIFWKYYNGRLGLVEFTNYFKKVDLECMLYFAKHNTLSFYRLIIDRFTVGLTQIISHWLLIALFLLIILWLLKVRRINLKIISYKLHESNVLVILILFIVSYALAVTAMHSVNCYSEPCVRLYSVPFIGTGFLMLMGISGISFFDTSKSIRYLLTGAVIVYQCMVVYRINHEVDKNRIKDENPVYDNAILFLKKQKGEKIIEGAATTGFNRYWFAKGGSFLAMDVFPYQRHHDRGEHYYYPDVEYKKMIVARQSSMKEDEILLIEFSDDFLKKYKEWVGELKPVWQRENMYIFKKLN